MGYFRFGKSMKIAPGVKLNFNKNSMGLTFGGKGLHYTVNSKGTETTSVGIPGTGLSYVNQSRLDKTQNNAHYDYTSDLYKSFNNCNENGAQYSPSVKYSKSIDIPENLIEDKHQNMITIHGITYEPKNACSNLMGIHKGYTMF